MAGVNPFASPGQRAAGRGGDEGDAPKEGASVSAALSTLESAIKTPRGHAALKTLRSELEGSGDEKPKPDKADTPGMKAAGKFNFNK